MDKGTCCVRGHVQRIAMCASVERIRCRRLEIVCCQVMEVALNMKLGGPAAVAFQSPSALGACLHSPRFGKYCGLEPHTSGVSTGTNLITWENYNLVQAVFV